MVQGPRRKKMLIEPVVMARFQREAEIDERDQGRRSVEAIDAAIKGGQRVALIVGKLPFVQQRVTCVVSLKLERVSCRWKSPTPTTLMV